MDLTASLRPKPVPGLRAALFDLDGTLLDTLSDLAASVNEALAAQGLPTLPAERYRLLVGTGARNLARLAAEAALLSAGRSAPDAADRSVRIAPDVHRDFQAAYGARWDRETKPYPGIPEALETLAARGIPAGVLSNKPDAFTKRLVARFFPGIPFAAVHGERDGVPRKPDPASAAEALAALGVPPSGIAYVGDSGTDMAFASACGFLPVGVLWGFRDRAELEAGGAKRLLDRPGSLPALFPSPAGEEDR